MVNFIKGFLNFLNRASIPLILELTQPDLTAVIQEACK